MGGTLVHLCTQVQACVAYKVSTRGCVHCTCFLTKCCVQPAYRQNPTLQEQQKTNPELSSLFRDFFASSHTHVCSNVFYGTNVPRLSNLSTPNPEIKKETSEVFRIPGRTAFCVSFSCNCPKFVPISLLYVFHLLFN